MPFAVKPSSGMSFHKPSMSYSTKFTTSSSALAQFPGMRRRQHDPNRPGHFWCFIDIFRKSHDFPSGIPDESKQRPHFRLKKVIRNSTKIFKRAKKYFVADDSKDGVEIGHDFDGDDVRKISYSESETTQLDVLHTTLYQLLKEGYSKRDIAELFSKSDNIPSEERLSAKLNGLSFRSAIDNDSENIVISTVQVQWSGKTSRSTHECIQASVKTPQIFFHLRCSDKCYGKTPYYTIQDTLRGTLRLCM